MPHGETVCHEHNGLLSAVPATLLHGVEGSSGFGDEIVLAVLLGGIIVALVIAARRGRRKAKRRRR
ncbi:MAG: hypothetical protein QF659_01045 [Dehalococcoidia bacterium]|jgi:hypothetical protein|nr:hypothetical protein [Dehalococcoidia bacterium]